MTLNNQLGSSICSCPPTHVRLLVSVSVGSLVHTVRWDKQADAKRTECLGLKPNPPDHYICAKRWFRLKRPAQSRDQSFHLRIRIVPPHNGPFQTGTYLQHPPKKKNASQRLFDFSLQPTSMGIILGCSFGRAGGRRKSALQPPLSFYPSHVPFFSCLSTVHDLFGVHTFLFGEARLPFALWQ